MAELVQVLDDAAHTITLLTAAGTTAPPVNPTDGVDTGVWRGGSSFNPRRCALRFVAAAAANLTALSVWAFYAGAWSKIAVPAAITFAAGDLSFTVFVDFPIGSRIAVAYTLSASSVTVTGYALENYVC